jgi:hypothetical protein
VIDETGKVEDVRAVSGPSVLAERAVRAVSREKFEPTLLDGRAVPRALTADADFRLLRYAQIPRGRVLQPA